jgi:hypothetical protein
MRVYRLNQELGQPMPQFSNDDVLQFMVTEAVLLRGLQARKEESKKRQKEDWKRFR